MVQDDPEDLVQELHMGQVLRRHPLGRSILGREKTIRGLRRQDLLNYIETYYDPWQTVVSIAGNFEQTKLARLVARYFGKGRASRAAHATGRCPSGRPGGVLLKEETLEPGP